MKNLLKQFNSKLIQQALRKNEVKVQKVCIKEIDEELRIHQLYNSGESGVHFKTLIEANTSIIVFIRHFNCKTCRNFVNIMGKQLDFEYILRKKINFSVIGCSKQKFIKPFLQSVSFPSERLYTDPDYFTYTKFGLLKEISSINGVVGNLTNLIPLQKEDILKDLQELKIGDSEEASWLGGSFVINQSGQILFNQLDETIENHVNIEQLMELVNKYGSEVEKRIFI